MNVKGDILGTEHCYMAVLLPLAMSTYGAVTSSSLVLVSGYKGVVLCRCCSCSYYFLLLDCCYSCAIYDLYGCYCYLLIIIMDF